MRECTKCGVCVCWGIIFALIFLGTANAFSERTTKTSSGKAPRLNQAKQAGRQDDSLNPKPGPDLALRVGGAHKADALAHFVEGMAFEENGEMDRALGRNVQFVGGDCAGAVVIVELPPPLMGDDRDRKFVRERGARLGAENQPHGRNRDEEQNQCGA